MTDLQIQILDSVGNIYKIKRLNSTIQTAIVNLEKVQRMAKLNTKLLKEATK